MATCEGKPSKPSENGAGDTDCDGGADCPKKPQVKVKIVPGHASFVACPGHPFQLTAVGEPGGGTFAWTMSGGDKVQLVDGAGNPKTTGDTVFLRGFKADDATGKIPEQSVSVTVTYTHPDGTATETKTVKIHKIDFDVTNTTVTMGATASNESAGSVTLGGAPGVPTMTTDPRVEIQLDASCPRKALCAANHRVGWLQTMLTNDRRLRYTHTLATGTAASMPIRDIITGAPVFPFYFWVTPFTADRDKQTAHHEDSPSLTGPWNDTGIRPAAPGPPPAINNQLRQAFCSNSFNAWLVVQNIEWSAHDLAGSFAFQKNMSWSMRLDATVDTTQAVGSRLTPATNAAPPTTMSTGKGGSSPLLTVPVYNTTLTFAITAAPGI